MPAHIRFICLVTISPLVLLFGLVCDAFAQNPRPQDQSEVVRVYTDLVQTDVTVFDRSGRFVEGLRKEDFELRIDGKVRPIEFFERVTVGAANEESQLMAARGTSSPDRNIPAAVPLDRGRTVFFYVDDMHLGVSGLAATRKMVNAFLDNEMSQNDESAISSASGVIGFLQQLTDNKAVLRAALERIKPRPYSNRDNETPPMTEYQALQINRFDRSVLDYFAEETMRRNPGISRATAESIVQGRATVLLQQGANVTRITLAGLEGLVKASRRLTGRKLVFFISEGFFVDSRSSDSLDRLRRITSDAAKSGVVIYSLDARGLTTPLSDPAQEAAFDPSGRLVSASRGELFASQDGLNGLARDTGGRPFFNSNSL
ncbi:MAG: VWA domain-containing protein, partial [Pyrinomonadaceae bacterium]